MSEHDLKTRGDLEDFGWGIRNEMLDVPTNIQFVVELYIDDIKALFPETELKYFHNITYHAKSGVKITIHPKRY